MDFWLSSKNFDEFCPEVGYFVTWAGDKFCTNWTLTDARLCLWLPAGEGWGVGIPLTCCLFFILREFPWISTWLPLWGQLETKDSYYKTLVNLGINWHHCWLIFSGKVVKIGFAQSLFDSSDMTMVTNAVDKRREVKLDNLILITNKDANAVRK